MGYSSGYHARTLGLGKAGNLPSQPGKSYVFLGDQNEEAIRRIVGEKNYSPEDLESAKRIAAEDINKKLHEFFKSAYAAGARKATDEAQVGQRQRMAASAGSGATVIALLALLNDLNSTKIETTPVD